MSRNKGNKSKASPQDGASGYAQLHVDSESEEAADGSKQKEGLADDQLTNPILEVEV